MFRRRGFARPLRRAFAPDIPPALQRANELMAIGDYNGAAVAFEGLERGAEGRGGPRAPHLYLQAGRARLQIGQVAAGMGHIRHGFALFAARQQWPALHRTGQLTVAFLTERGLAKEALEISYYLKATLPPVPAAAALFALTRSSGWTRSRLSVLIAAARCGEKTKHKDTKGAKILCVHKGLSVVFFVPLW